MLIRFWSQGLDNKHDHFATYMLSSDPADEYRSDNVSVVSDNIERTQIISRVSEIRRRGKAVDTVVNDTPNKHSLSPEMYVDGNNFYVQVIPNERDTAEVPRKAPIICIVQDIDPEDRKNIDDVVVLAIEAYIGVINRSLSDETKKSLEQLIKGQKKTQPYPPPMPIPKYIRVLIAIAIFISLLVLIAKLRR